ncbi:uncharacterized protein LY89DRAFT_88014 [Mollisia scopiformis]|uniref:Uncharacterized protein n=1 Tax=Mollisia scopiformis TaxID=149040 RepID=A0A194X8V9_MOLSC|nr:uncharacterized protein LY89DRAFT_88014 [Mollisia scopiformis]KUJ16605.1 hypothetical protein LY89DRAFT_88014 [Mollisia scopiformis]
MSPREALGYIPETLAPNGQAPSRAFTRQADPGNDLKADIAADARQRESQIAAMLREGVRSGQHSDKLDEALSVYKTAAKSYQEASVNHLAHKAMWNTLSKSFKGIEPSIPLDKVRSLPEYTPARSISGYKSVRDIITNELDRLGKNELEIEAGFAKKMVAAYELWDLGPWDMDFARYMIEEDMWKYLIEKTAGRVGPFPGQLWDGFVALRLRGDAVYRRESPARQHTPRRRLPSSPPRGRSSEEKRLDPRAKVDRAPGKERSMTIEQRVETRSFYDNSRSGKGRSTQGLTKTEYGPSPQHRRSRSPRRQSRTRERSRRRYSRGHYESNSTKRARSNLSADRSNKRRERSRYDQDRAHDRGRNTSPNDSDWSHRASVSQRPLTRR